MKILHAASRLYKIWGHASTCMMEVICPALVLCQARLGLKATGFGLACTGFRPGKPQAKPGARRSGRAPAWLWLGPRLLAPNAPCGGADGLGLQ